MDRKPVLASQDLDEIEARAAGLYEYATGLDAAWQAEADQLAGTDVPALAAAVRRLQTQRKYLITQLAKRDAATGDGDRALREFLGGQPAESEPGSGKRAEEAEARVRELERLAVEAKRNEIRDSFAELAAAAREEGDFQGAFNVECGLRKREEQWATEDAAAASAAGESGSSK